ncbi:MAG: hypothetical protein A3K19_18650 [Lentisphaerae bacterium RIFOXYB12_FULL_65_16]|nr:MAG: hypothetical protein A3K18_00950 [Lentisphaerae bacterium RIFOXYA12_64_32]OGV92366.1 MAG: hypothetical protein A3K19_18650 [Lentisphaerae bacterium RIFOXYB12_FULL_65_16]
MAPLNENWLSRVAPLPHIVNCALSSGAWVEPLRVIYDHELVLVSEGEFLIEIEGERFRLGPNSYVIVPPGRLHQSRLLTSAGGVRRWVHFDWDWLAPHPEAPVMTFAPAQPRVECMRWAPTWVPRQVLSGPIQRTTRVFDLYERLRDRWREGGLHRQLLCRALLLELLVELLDPDRPGVAATGDDPVAERVRRRLEELADRPLGNAPSIRAVLKGFGFSYGHLCRVFKQRHGITPLGYVNALRIERAKGLLVDTTQSVSEVAGRLGFDNLAYFSRLFRKRTGQTPTAFRAASRAGG